MMLSRILRAKAPQPQECGDARPRSSSRTHVGHVRKINEDRILDRPERNLWAVADGMGGHHGGDVAAQLAIDALDALDSPTADTIVEALKGANAALFNRGHAGERRSGTTIVAANMQGNIAEIFWAGDSRAYRIRDGVLELLTHDHSLVQELLDAGALSAEEAMRHPKANVITRALGVEDHIVIDRVQIALQGGDLILLCSDGLSRTIDARVPSALSLHDLASHLIDRAVGRDGTDNASLVIAAIS
ncbi:PP2C family serine/threonine-protein phosphatase [Sphingopyxis sp. KK2]|uniref:PP2C family protein-serine/threonine phosphatase n=1 Tax=Sphingopyxis sp. KK2 TaxID=1855727 RepID=UPI002119109E|nr:protein phosphatase 2C domain-containing protein [Sphingopyxis sp. KK2]